MQHRYVGDVGDFAKYSLLRTLAECESELQLGVLWYLFPDESHNGDGRHVSYLNEPGFQARDPELHAQLKDLVVSGKRSIAAIEEGNILNRAKFFSEGVAVNGPPGVRLSHRREWFANGLKALGNCDLVFFDPDNGIETSSLKKSDYRAGKYVFWDEIADFWSAGASLVIYNHLNRTAPAAIQTSRLLAAFSDRLPNIGFSTPLLFRRGSCRHLWVIAQPRHSDILRARIISFLGRGWHRDTDCEFNVTRPFNEVSARAR